MKQPQELMSMFILPGIRNHIVKELKNEGLKQEFIAELLDVTPSAISQYLKDKRGCEVEFCDKFSKKIKVVVKDLSSSFGDDMDINKYLVFKIVNELSLYYKKEKMLCSMCKTTNEIAKCGVNCN